MPPLDWLSRENPTDKRITGRFGAKLATDVAGRFLRRNCRHRCRFNRLRRLIERRLAGAPSAPGKQQRRRKN